ncbi:DUF3473 domain-containing protein [Bacteroidales bacterium SW299]|nr:DUF3473 domain-containing protein [Bacteroidales bacterium SW299]
MHILSFDIEEWYIEKRLSGGRAEKYKEFDFYLNKILDILDTYQLKATFFCLGKIASDFPYVVRTIASRGHEIGCHSNEHIWLTRLSPKKLLADTKTAISALEDVCGQKVISYRAPAFSIGETNKWAIEILAECGIELDASVYPAARDFGGFSAFPAAIPCIIRYGSIQLKEFPIGLTTFFGKKIAYSGGGYFRFFPLFYTKHKIQQSEYSVSYFHIGDLMPHKGGMLSQNQYEYYFKEKGTLLNRCKRYIKSNLGTKYTFSKMTRLLNGNHFTNLRDANRQIDWNVTPIIDL